MVFYWNSSWYICRNNNWVANVWIMDMTENQIKIIINLLDREIDNYKSVYDRTNKVIWLDNVDELELIKSKLQQKFIDNQIELEKELNDQIIYRLDNLN